jgi:type IV pilus assembly protein PilV
MLQNLRGYKEQDAMNAQPKWFFTGPHKNPKSRKTRSYLKSKKGFTLVELMVAVTLMAIGLFALVGMQIVALNSTNIAYQLTTASALAESVLEDVMSWDNSDPRLKTPLNTPLTSGFAIGSSPYTISNVPYKFGCTFTQNTPISGITMVQVQVTSNNGAGRNITITAYRRVL